MERRGGVGLVAAILPCDTMALPRSDRGFSHGVCGASAGRRLWCLTSAQTFNLEALLCASMLTCCVSGDVTMVTVVVSTFKTMET